MYQASKQASKKTDFTVDPIWWGLLRLAPIMLHIMLALVQSNCLRTCCIAAHACLHSEDEMFNAINTAISDSKDTTTYRVTTFSYPVQGQLRDFKVSNPLSPARADMHADAG